MMEQMNNYGLEAEIRGLKDDEKVSTDYLSIQKENLAKSLKNGDGEDMVKLLKNPPKPNRWLGFKIKFSRWWNGIRGQ